MGIWTKPSLPDAGASLSVDRPVGVFGILLFLSVISGAVQVPAPTPPKPHRLRRTSVPFSAWPQRREQHCLKCCKWDAEPYNPNERG